jgi:DNA-binding NarL/FixJ family response regulator
MLRIPLAHDHDLVRAGLRSSLERQNDWNICGEQSNGRIAGRLIARPSEPS